MNRIVPTVAATWLMGLGSIVLTTGSLLAQDATPSGAPQESVSATIPDAQVEANVLKALAAKPELADQSVSTTTVYGVVTLTGAVRDEASRSLAEQTISTTVGVRKVIDELTIGVPATGAAGDEPNDSSGTQDGSNPALQSDGSIAGGPPQAPSQPQTPAQPEVPRQPGSMGPQGDNNPDGGWAGDRPLPSDRPAPRYGHGPQYGDPPSGYRNGQEEPHGPQQAGLQVVVPEGSLLRVRIDSGMDSQHAQVGATFDGIVLNNVYANGNVAIPRGASVVGRVVDVQESGAFRGRGELALELTQLTLDGQTYPLATDSWTREGMNKTGATVGNAVGMGVTGALIGAVVGGGPGALLGAGMGGAAGLGTSAAYGGGRIFIPAEAILTFHLVQQTTVITVGQAELDGLAAGVPQLAPPVGRTRLRPTSYAY